MRTGAGSGPRSGIGCDANERSVNASVVVILLECGELAFKGVGAPERNEVEEFPSDCSDEPFDERMRQGHVRHGLHLRYVEDPEIRLPSLKLKERIVITAEVAG